MPQDKTSDFTPLADQFYERRKGSPMPVILELLKHIHTDQKNLDAKLTAHMTAETSELTQAVLQLRSDAFPDGDPTKHLAYHELLIQQAKDRAKFWQEMKIAAGKWAGLGVLGLIVTLLYTGLMTKFLLLIAGVKHET